MRCVSSRIIKSFIFRHSHFGALMLFTQLFRLSPAAACCHVAHMTVCVCVYVSVLRAVMQCTCKITALNNIDIKFENRISFRICDVYTWMAFILVRKTQQPIELNTVVRPAFYSESMRGKRGD